MSDEAPAKQVEEGLPAWVMTFADLMSLLMCFFVLLLSFSEMDVSKYKEMAGSMKNAFGVQRDIKVREPPKGINVIAREFSPGRPEPTIMNVIRQMTTNDLHVNLDLGKERRRPVPTPKSEHTPDKTRNLKPHEKAANMADNQAGQKAGQRADQTAGEKNGDQAQSLAGKQLSQAEGLTDTQKKELAKAKALAEVRLKEKLKMEANTAAAQGKAVTAIENKSLEELIRTKAEEKRRKKLEHSARLISNALGREIKEGGVDVEVEGKKIIIRVREKASFGSGHADLKGSFRPILAKVAEILKGSEGKIIVAGHTDNIPIYTERFRSNWELSSARAVSVAHEMMLATDIPSSRFLIQGFADTKPMVPNTTPANRAKNRRVEIILQQGEDEDGKDISATLPSTPVTPQTGAVPAPVKKPVARMKGKKPVAAGGVKRVTRPATKPKAVKGVRAGGANRPAPEKVEEKTSKPSSGLGIKLGGSK
ncbi:chemotaxis protein MotB [Thiogranum longum]|uniref:Chemotaxis protein MotB n=1 Tax=Thiogranum longum TaxID=1537524 RepID=A0A4R1H6J1_9GAMM|nr:MotB family protein [Thiogranum longum]TCK17354.1 chemotaxis protein MotB [Thiogranum longum]